MKKKEKFGRGTYNHNYIKKWKYWNATLYQQFEAIDEELSEKCL